MPRPCSCSRRTPHNSRPAHPTPLDIRAWRQRWFPLQTFRGSVSGDAAPTLRGGEWAHVRPLPSPRPPSLRSSYLSAVAFPLYHTPSLAPPTPWPLGAPSPFVSTLSLSPLHPPHPPLPPAEPSPTRKRAERCTPACVRLSAFASLTHGCALPFVLRPQASRAVAAARASGSLRSPSSHASASLPPPPRPPRPRRACCIFRKCFRGAAKSEP